VRPNYHSDGDTRPTYRGTAYAVVRRTGVAWAGLALYAGFALWSCATAPHYPLLACRAFHCVALYYNVVLSDGLHNLDKHMGAAAYAQPGTVAVEQKLHARDWRAALAVPASYHMMLIFGVMDPARLVATDGYLLGANLLACAIMCVRTTPARITPARELFLSFVATFGIQMLILLVAFYREREYHGAWLPLWGVYAVGLLAKAVEKPDNMTFGHHEVLHASCLAGHAIGLVVDAMTT
jgi:hypothetical protein